MKCIMWDERCEMKTDTEYSFLHVGFLLRVNTQSVAIVLLITNTEHGLIWIWYKKENPLMNFIRGFFVVI
jgi:hypothetical protein